MSKSFYNFITIVSLLSLFHCAYSAAQHRAYLRLIEQPFISLPTDILAQVLISLCVLIYGASFVASPFQYIKSDPNRDKSWDDVASCLSFATFGNRAYAMSPAHAIRQQELVKQYDVDNFLSILTLSKKVQPEMFAVHALNVELAMIRDKIESRGNKDTTGMYRLQFWKDALSSIYSQSSLPVPRQPVAVALCSFASEAEPQFLDSLVTARQQTLGDKPFSNVFEVCGYGARTTGSLIQLRADCLVRFSSIDTKVYQEDIKRSATDIGGAFGVMNLIRSTLPLFTRGIVLLPLDMLNLNGLTPDKVYRKKQPEDVQHVVRDMVRVAESQLESGRNRASKLPRSIRQAFNPAVCITSHLISTTKKLNYDIYSPYLQRRKPLLLWSLLYHKFLGSL